MLLEAIRRCNDYGATNLWRMLTREQAHPGARCGWQGRADP